MKWISAKERLPDVAEWRDRFIVYGTPTCGRCGDEPTVMEAKFYKEKNCFEFGEYDCGIDVTHWMPLPEAPKE